MDERGEPQRGDLRGDLVQLVRDAGAGRHHREVLAPALQQPQRDAFEELHHRVGGGPDGQPGQRALIQRERVPDQADEAAGAVDVVAERVEQVPDLRVLAVEGVLDRVPRILEPPHAVRDEGEDDPAHEAFHGEDAQDERAAQFGVAADPGRRGGRPGRRRRPGDERGAAQALPGLPGRGAGVQPRADLRLRRRVADMAAQCACQQIPVHLVQPKPAAADHQRPTHPAARCRGDGAGALPAPRAPAPARHAAGGLNCGR